MKTLTLVRHAKSSWDHPGLKDFDRPLNTRGLRNAPDMGQRLAAHALCPDLMISSPANRAITTARILAEQMGYPLDRIRAADSVYAADADDLFRVLHDIEEGPSHVMVVGHNPGLTVWSYELSGHHIDNIPTCGMVILSLDIASWRHAKPGTARFVGYDNPRNTSGTLITS